MKFSDKDDPQEKNNLAGEMPCKVRELEKQINKYRKITKHPKLKEPLALHNNPNGDPRNTDDKFWPGWC